MAFFKKVDLSGKYAAIDVVNYFLTRGIEKNYQLSNLQVQKILYYIQRDFLKNDSRALFSDDFEAWQFGPVIRKIYNDFCGFGAMPIYYLPQQAKEINPADAERIGKIVDEKRRYSPWELVNDTHAKNKAWDLVYRNGAGYENIIPKELIMYYG